MKKSPSKSLAFIGLVLLIASLIVVEGNSTLVAGLFCLSVLSFVASVILLVRSKKRNYTVAKMEYIQSVRDLCLNAETPSLYVENYLEMIEELKTLSGNNSLTKQEKDNIQGTILQAEKDFQWQLRNAIDRMKKKTLSTIKGKYANSKEYREEEYITFVDELSNVKEYFDNDETREFAKSAAEKVYSAAGSEYPIHQALFPAKTEPVKEGPVTVSGIDGMEGHQFEYWCADLLRRNGFFDVKVTPGSGDQGVDILATKDDIKYAFQCKNYSNTVGNTPVQEIHAGKDFYKCHIGVVITNNYFTQGAKELASQTGVLLWDRDKLAQMMQDGE